MLAEVPVQSGESAAPSEVLYEDKLTIYLFQNNNKNSVALFEREHGHFIDILPNIHPSHNITGGILIVHIAIRQTFCCVKSSNSCIPMVTTLLTMS